MSKLSVKYLDAETGDYKYATVIDVGDLDKLNTKVKSDLVSAINSIGITGELPGGIQNQLDEINQSINDIQSGELTEPQVAEINKKITEGISSLVIEVGELNTKINDDIVKAKNELLSDIDQKLENVENDYNSKIGVISGTLDGAKADIDSVESDLINIGTKLQTAETNYTKVSSDIDTINGELSTKVESSDFNLMESKVSQNTTEINQTKEDISLLATKSSLDLATDRVTKAESDIKINADGLSSRVTYTELNEQLDNASKYGDNILRGTRNWDNWETNNIAKAYISNDTYRHCKIQVVEDKQYYYETELDGLEIGKTYIASIYFKTEVESDYASVNINIGSESIPLDNLVEDTLILNGWKRVSANFVASDVKTKVSFRFSFLDTNNIGYLVASKIETGIKPSEWKPHFDDDNESIIKNETLIKQNSDSIVSLVSSTEKLGEDIETANTQITQTAESLSLQAQKITDIEGEVSENNASIVLANNKIETKVSQTDVDKSISDISLDTKNRIINSDFSRGFSNWNEINSGFTIKKISGVNYAHIDRSGLINVSIASMASDKFPAKNGDKLVFSLDFMTESISSLDDKTIMTIELFDINDTRVFSKTFNVADFNVSIVDNVITRISSKYIVAREDVAKARVKIQLNKNGSVNFSKISLQKGDLKEKEWLLAPEDVQLLNVDLQTSIKQNADNIELRATKTELDTINNIVKENKAVIEVTNNAISQKVSSTDVENILNDKAYATKSDVNKIGKYTAYAYSADGTDRFTVAYPNLNLLKGTKTPKSITGNNTVNQGGLLYSFDNNNTLNHQGFNINDTVTLEFDWSATNPASGTFILQWQGQPWGFNVPQIKISSTNGSGHVAHTFNITDLQIASTAVATGIGYRFDNIPTNTVITFSNVIISKAKTSQPWMPSEKELTSDDIPKYVGYSVRQSENPKDFSWQPYGGLNSYNITKATTAIDQNSKEIALKANKTEVDTLSGRVLATESSLQIQDGKIIALNTKADGHTTQIGTLESSYNGLTSTISEIQTDVGGKADKTELSQLSQDLSGFKTTVANTYADKVSVASQITQLSDNINLKVSKGDVVSQINVEAGQILFNSNKLVLNANTTEISGNAFIRGDMIVDGTIKAKQLDVEKISSISSDIGDINAGSFITWDVLDKNPRSDMYTLTAIYINNGIQKTMSILSIIEIDKDTPISAEVVKSITTNDISSGRILLSSANDNSINSELPSHIIGITPDELLKNSYLYTDAVIESGSSVYSGQRYTSLYLEGDNIVLKPIHDPDTEGYIGALPRLNINHEVSISRNLEVSNHISANGRSLSQRATQVKAIYFGIVWIFRRIGDIVYVDVNRQGVTIPRSKEEDLATEGIPTGFKPAYKHSFSLSANVSAYVGADVIINMLGDNNGYMNITNTTTTFKVVQGSTSYITNDPFPS